ncbi:MAG: HAD-IIIA family hydrolase [Capsulimonadales bacterium]|nr:HAD-IIIA family hydrolase [Capsulimonadales bacterium]
MSRPAVFLDRDGVLNVYLPEDYVKTSDELILLPGIGAAIARLNRAGLPVFIISNQQGVGKGLMTEDDLTAIDRALCVEIGRTGGSIERSYYCTALASENSEERKPRPGMLLRAAREHDLDLSASVFVGDTETDALAARAAGVGHFVLVLTGKHRTADIAANPARFPHPPDHVAADLASAVDWILTRTR